MSGGKSNSSNNSRMACHCHVICKGNCPRCGKKKCYLVCKCKQVGCDKTKPIDNAVSNIQNSVSSGSSSSTSYGSKNGYGSKSSKIVGSYKGSHGGSGSKNSKYGNGSEKPKSSKKGSLNKYEK